MNNLSSPRNPPIVSLSPKHPKPHQRRTLLPHTRQSPPLYSKLPIYSEHSHVSHLHADRTKSQVERTNVEPPPTGPTHIQPSHPLAPSEPTPFFTATSRSSTFHNAAGDLDSGADHTARRREHTRHQAAVRCQEYTLSTS